MNELSDIELWGRMRDADASALEQLFTRHYQRLCSFAYRYVRSDQQAEEIVSDVFVKLWEKRAELPLPSSVRSYLYTSVRNHSLNHLARRRSQLEALDDHAERLPDDAHDAARGLEQQEVLAEVEDLIRQMPPRRQAIFRMSRLDGLKYKEIANILQISVNTVQNQMVEAVKHLASFHRPARAEAAEPAGHEKGSR
ncbi:MAG: RNA polymerase sigma-70 factor [Verrucomicrobiota bacterium JB022]|nr:RNA polymerase sigma-70 factor [Verrucomicrobiota bacterium JB022]